MDYNSRADLTIWFLPASRKINVKSSSRSWQCAGSQAVYTSGRRLWGWQMAIYEPGKAPHLEDRRTLVGRIVKWYLTGRLHCTSESRENTAVSQKKVRIYIYAQEDGSWKVVISSRLKMLKVCGISSSRSSTAIAALPKNQSKTVPVVTPIASLAQKHYGIIH